MAADLSPKVIFFDAFGTLFHLRESVGANYALAGRRVGLELDAAALDDAFARVWKEMPMRPATGIPREDDDKNWWRDLVDRVLARVQPALSELDRDAFFEVAYSHFAEADIWELYPEVLEILDRLRRVARLGVISNFDGRLRMILEGLGVSNFFSAIVISSEVGADKPDPLIFQRALDLLGVTADDALHVGDDPVHDWEGATAAGISVFKLERPRQTLREVSSLAPSRDVV